MKNNIYLYIDIHRERKRLKDACGILIHDVNSGTIKQMYCQGKLLG